MLFRKSFLHCHSFGNGLYIDFVLITGSRSGRRRWCDVPLFAGPRSARAGWRSRQAQSITMLGCLRIWTLARWSTKF
ncbi:hypothetical protein FYA67_10685 [Bordetella holmesii]|nr:hypothetical protein FYB59_10680 [Bordetella holmesii]QGB15233.1 hypothetical protein FYB57_10680 [Bordetella holmesii]QGB64480.1 hypothetical protein FYB43_10680 [Bordetella holmesii]QGC43029.1 hypothetical protein FYB19_10690 [Bordetella holmesii]QGC62938.1 hypothetical protein FYB13_10680 [Bordetella holmesii]